MTGLFVGKRWVSRRGDEWTVSDVAIMPNQKLGTVSILVYGVTTITNHPNVGANDCPKT